VTQVQATYPVPKYGKATSFAEAEIPIEYALEVENRFINQAGGMEKRRGLSKLGADLPTGRNITSIHEHVDVKGSATLFASDSNKIFKYNSSTSAWATALSVSASGRFQSVQFNERLIFVNGTARNFFTTDTSSFVELLPVIEEGTLGGTKISANGMEDSDISDWLNTDIVTDNDVIHYTNTNIFTLITSAGVVAASALQHPGVSASGPGLQGSNAGKTGAPPVAGEFYEIIDLVELNVIGSANVKVKDNVATIVSSPNISSEIHVSGLDWTQTEVRAGDFIVNTTRISTIAMVSAISASALTITEISGVAAGVRQVAGDSVTLLKKAMPISTFAHTHYGHLYLIDARDQRKIRISGVDDPQNFTSSTGTLDSISFQQGTQAPEGDIIKAIGTFQNFLAIAGEENVFLYSGTVPIGTDADLKPVAVFPQGLVGSRAMQSIGNDLAFLSLDGLQAAQQTQAATQLLRYGLTFPINTTLREEISDLNDLAKENDVFLAHYRRRAWLLLSVGDNLHIYNYTNIAANAPTGRIRGGDAPANTGASITDFTGLFARQKVYFERKNGDLVMGGSDAGKIFRFDVDGSFDDQGQEYSTRFKTGWLSLSETTKKRDIRIKHLKYIKPIIETGVNIDYTFRVIGGFDAISSDTAIVKVSGNAEAVGTAIIPFVIGGAAIVNKKFPFRARADYFQIEINTNDTSGPDIITRYTLYANILGLE